MRIAFYAPLKPPSHETPSGDRRVARLYMEALGRCGHEVALASTFRSFDRDGDATRQSALRDAGLSLARELCARWQNGPCNVNDPRPDLWFTYHVYHKAPDWLGPSVSRELRIPYVIAEPSHAPKRADGPWSPGYRAARDAIEKADLLLCPIRDDIACLEPLAAGRIVFLPPFLDAAPFSQPAGMRDARRAGLAAKHALDPSVPWIVVAAMMRTGDKLASYLALAGALEGLKDLRWQLLVAGDGPARAQVESALEAAVPGRVRLLGTLGQTELAALFSSCHAYVWPGINEAYGMALLEAQAAGVPVVSSRARGITDVVIDGRTGLLAPPGEAQALADRVRTLLVDESLRTRMGRQAAEFVLHERSIDASSEKLGDALARIPAR